MRRLSPTTLDFDKLVPAEFDAYLGIDPATGQRKGSAGIDPQFWQLEQLQDWNLRQNIVLHFMQPHPATGADFPAYGRYFRACLREVRRRYPDLAPLYVVAFNEPDFEYPRPYENRNMRESVAFFDQFYEALSSDIRREFPDVTVLGPGVNQFGSWQVWKNWVVPFLDQSPSAQFFNCQPYAAHFSDLLAWTEMLQSQAVHRRGIRLPLVITETNTDLEQPGPQWWRDEYHVERVRAEAESLMGMMQHPDQFKIREYFFYHYACNWHDMWFRHDGVNEPAPMYWLYWLLRDVHGTRVFSAVNREQDSDLKTIAARDGSDMTLAIFNGGSADRSVHIDLHWPTGIVEPSLVIENLRYDPARKQFVHETNGQGPLSAPLAIAPGEVKKLRWTKHASC